MISPERDNPASLRQGEPNHQVAIGHLIGQPPHDVFLCRNDSSCTDSCMRFMLTVHVNRSAMEMRTELLLSLLKNCNTTNRFGARHVRATIKFVTKRKNLRLRRLVNRKSGGIFTSISNSHSNSLIHIEVFFPNLQFRVPEIHFSVSRKKISRIPVH